MSMLVGNFETHNTFHEYIMEGIEPKETIYGSNSPLFNNKHIGVQGNIKITCFIHNGILYFIQMNKMTGEIGFAKSLVIPNTDKELRELTFDVEPTKDSDGLGVFNKSFFVFLKVIEDTSGVKKIFFKPASQGLNKLYTLLTKSKNFSNTLNRLGFSNLEFNGEIFVSNRLN